MATLIPGSATSEGTTRYTARLAGRVAAGHFGDLDGLAVSTLGIGTYLGREDAETDVAYQDALVRALELGINTVDTAVNYRHQRSERAIRTALAAAFGRG
ncbi:MAG: aldo/keto reductase, partial [Candidatus Rokuibacteriota bacterium]